MCPRRLSALAGIAAAAFVAGQAAAVCAQSLGELAKKEEERRKQVTQSGKVYTNKDLASVPPSTMPPPAPPADAAGPDAKDAKDAKDAAKSGDSAKGKDDKAAAKDPAKDQAYWAGRKKALQDALDRDMSFADALQSKINALTTDFVNRDDPAQRAVIERNRLKALAELDGLKKQIVADKKALADFEEEARHAGVPPGWLR
jgi:hypothetical protein